MAKPKTQFVCQSCGSSFNKWSGKCDGCHEWNTLVEETTSAATPTSNRLRGGRKISFTGLKGETKSPPRVHSGIKEFDRVCGGGVVRGSAILIGGNPGIGKSTLLLQLAANLSETMKVGYVSGEEAIEQIRLRAERLDVTEAKAELASSTNVRDVLATLEGPESPDLLIIDSIQTMYIDTLDSAPGTVAQVRASAAELIHTCKKKGVCLILVGHVTKEGMIAGPKVLEHMVDTVLYFEGEKSHQFRILRAVKNRFGPANEIGVFEMVEKGLAEVTNPSALFLSERDTDVSGACVFAGMEGSRPVLVELQTLVAPSPLGTPRRTVVGWDQARLSMIVAVLETRCGMQLAGNDIFLNVAGGLKISEPAADLAVAASLISSVLGTPLPNDMVVMGEIGLSGEIRSVGQIDVRLKEAAKLGFKKALVPQKLAKLNNPPLEIIPLRECYDLLQYGRSLKQQSTPKETLIA